MTINIGALRGECRENQSANTIPLVMALPLHFYHEPSETEGSGGLLL